MKKLVLGLCLIASVGIPALAQTNIDAMEYFFDSDPGIGNGIVIPITPGPVQDVNLSISTSGLAIGFHTLIIRAKHQSGGWGVQDSRVMYVASQTVVVDAFIGNMEYYFDSDPGPGNGTIIGLPTSFPTSVDFDALIATSSLASGFHILHIRAQDGDGNWGIPDSRPFYIVAGSVDTQASVIQLEYFFDNEPGFGNGTQLSITAGTQINFLALINSTALSNGFHSISIRAKDNDGQWGFAETRTFYVDAFSQVTAIEYYIDTDPGEGTATPVTVTTGGTIDLNFTIPTSSLGGGSHIIGIRAAGTDGSWGDTKTSSFSIQEGQTITFAALAAAIYGDAPFTLTGTTSSGLILSYGSSDPLVATVSGSTITIVGAGTTVITASQPGDATYGPATDMTQTLVVNKANQNITFGSLPVKTFGDVPFALGGTSTSSLSITYNSSNTGVATVSGSTVTIVGAGTTDIMASQAGNGNYNAAIAVVQSLVVLPANNTPALSVQSGSAFYINDAIVINNLINVTDADDELISATVAITSGFQSTEDQLLYTPQNGLTGNFNTTTGVLTISGPATVAGFQTALRSVQYNNSSPSPNTNDRIISIRVNDGVVTSNAVTITITINKPPAIAAPTKDTNAGGNIVFLVNDILSDPDNNLDLSTLKIVSAQGAMITISGNAITVNYSAVPDYEGTDELTITVCDVGGKCETQVVTVDVGADVEVFNGISSNNDGMNDYFKIRFLPPGSRVAIFNRWGDTVYENKEYDSNDPSKRFEGNSTDGKALVSGTYFYLIELPNDTRKRTGYLQIKQ